MRGLATIFLATGMALGATAQVRITEVLVNPPGSPDAGREFIEIQSCKPNFSLQGYWLIGIDGEYLFNPGNIHWAVDLSAYSTGDNGLLLVRDGSSVLLPEPDSATTVVVIPNAFTASGLQNDSYTVALVRNFTGQVNDDIDANDDGVIDNPLWEEAIGAFGWLDGEVSSGEVDAVYATQLNGVESPVEDRTVAGDTWEPDVIIFFQNGAFLVADAGRVTGAGDFGPFRTDNDEIVVYNGTLPSQFNREVTPGNLNPGDRPAVDGDVNCDRCVDDADLLQVLFNFGGNDASSDVNGDGVVDDADLLIVLFNFGNGC
ncbi:MAG: hypothetical protein WHS44_11885 [Fimbriimonadales bacterium]|nr:MAG: hypothetical protein KatS3mg018_2366 [Fimbriimonadales bacterium]